MYVKDVKKFIEKQRQHAQHYHKNTEGWRDIEYGRCCGGVSDLKGMLDREETEVDPLQMGVRTCPIFGPMRLAIGAAEGWHSIIHGTEGCAVILQYYCNISFACFRDKGKIHTTAMNKVDAILGAEEKLKQAILEVDRDFHPEGIIVFKSCASAVIGDDIKGVCDSLRDKVSCPLVAVDKPGGFASRHIGIGHGYVLEAMAEQLIAPPKKKIPNSINILGDWAALHPPEFRPPNDPEEIERVLNDMGVTVHSRVAGEHLDKITTAAEASLNMSICAVSFLDFARYMEKQYGMPWVTVNRPIGIANTTQMYLAIIDALGLGSDAEKVLEREIIETDKALEPYRETLRGKTFAVSLASGRMIGQVLLGIELGMRPVFLALHSLHEKVFPGLDVLAEVLAEEGYDEPEVIVEANLYEEGEVIDRLKPDVWYIDESQKTLALRHGQPFVNTMGETFEGVEMGYRGAITWAEHTVYAAKIASIFRKLGAPHLFLPKEPFSDVRETYKIERRC